MRKLSEILEWILQIKRLHSFNVVNMILIAEYFYQDAEGEFVYENVPLHSCTEAEWAKFNKPNSETESYFK